MSSYDPSYESSDEQNLCVFDADLETVSIEYLAENTDEFAANLVYAILGEQSFQELADAGEVRIMAVKMCTTFLQMMMERAKRQEAHAATVEKLNDLLW